MTEQNVLTINTTEVCPLMADVLNAITAARIPFGRLECMAVAALGFAMIKEEVTSDIDDDTIDALHMLSDTFISALSKMKEAEQ